MKKENLTQIIEVKPVDTSELQKEEKKATQVLELAKSVKITSQPIYEQGAETLKSIKARSRQLENVRKSITVPIDAAKKAVMDLFRNPQEMLNQAEKLLKTAMIEYTDKQEELRRAEQAKLEKAAEEERKRKEAQQRAWEEKEEAARAEVERLKKEGEEEAARKAEEQADKAAEKAEERAFQADNVMAPIAAPKVEKVTGVSYRDDWYAEVVDFTELSDDFKLPDMPKLNTTAKALKGTLKIPGVIFKSRKILASK